MYAEGDYGRSVNAMDRVKEFPWRVFTDFSCISYKKAI